MSPPITNLLLTGSPGCGKTTVVRRVIERLSHLRLVGFYTAEIRERGQRLGFETIGLGGGRAILAHVDFRTRHQVGRYSANVSSWNRVSSRWKSSSRSRASSKVAREWRTPWSSLGFNRSISW